MKRSAYDRAKNFLYSRDLIAEQKQALGRYRQDGDYVWAAISLGTMAFETVVAGWQSMSMVRAYNREGLRVNQAADDPNGPVAALAAAIIKAETTPVPAPTPTEDELLGVE